VADCGKNGAMLFDPHTDPLEMKVSEGKAHNVIFSPDGTRIAASSNDGSVAIWDTQTGAVQTYTGTGAAPR
jgi:WD40 repeat protein